MHIAYVYIQSYSILKNIGLSFDHRFSFTISGSTLLIKKNTALPDNFWENGIYSLTAIVGNNGCGKTTALLFMKSLFVKGATPQNKTKVIIVYEKEEELYIYNTTDINIKVNHKSTKTQHLSSIEPIETLYYSGHFRPYNGLEEEIQWAGSDEASDAWLLIRDLQDYSNVDTLHLTEPIYSHLLAYYAQNNYRICEILALKGLNNILKSVRLPKFVQFAPNKGGWQAIKLDRTELYKNINLPNIRVSSTTNKGKTLEKLIYYSITNLIAEEKGKRSELVTFMKKWMEFKKSENVITSFENSIEILKASEDTLESLNATLEVVRKLVDICDYDESCGVFYIDVQKNGDNLRKMMDDVIRSGFFLTAKYFDIIYSHTLGENARLSSGELELLNLLSRLYYGITIAPQKHSDNASPQLLLIDEAEIGFHPDWQRQYVNVLNEFMKYMRVQAGTDFQIVLTTHSPIILSDFPSCCVNYLKREEEETTQDFNEPETFSTNVFNLYSRAFL